MITVTTKAEAWDIAMALLGGKMSYSLDQKSSERAGYNIFRSEDSYYNYICDLGNRLEINMENGITKNIWIGIQDNTVNEDPCVNKNFMDKIADKVAEKLLKVYKNKP